MENLIKGFEIVGKNAGFNKPVISTYVNKVIDYSIDPVKNLSPTVIEEAPNGSLISYDVYTRLLKDRIIFFGHAVADETVNIAIAQMLFLEMTDAKKDITLYINSGGGSVVAGLGFIDVMDYVSPDVSTVAIGMAASMGAVILTSGTKGKRFALPNSEVMIHQILGGAEGQFSDMEIRLNHMKRLKDKLYKILADTSGQTVKKIEEKSNRDYWMLAEEAKKEGFIDEVIRKKK